jgi:hypothetical protein
MNKKLLSVILAAALFSAVFSDLGSHNSDTYFKTKAVLLLNPEKGIQCSGEQIQAPSGVNYILSAAHCRIIAQDNGSIEVHDADGRVIQRKVIAEDPNSDLLLIEGLPNVEGLKVAEYDEFDQHIRTYTHGHGMPTYKTEGVILKDEYVEVGIEQVKENKFDDCTQYPKNKVEPREDLFAGSIYVCTLTVNETMTTAFVVGGSSGGMVVDDSGNLVGVVSISDGPFSGLVRLADINKFLRNY